MRKYKIIYADPAWSYNDKCHAGKRGADYKYRTTSTESLQQIPVHRVIADDCALFMWATMPMLPDALSVMAAWGFKYKTVAFVWVKKNRKSDSDFFGMGNWTRSNAEVVLLGTVGKPRRVSMSVRQVVHSRIMAHSEKPSEVADRIVALMGDVPRLDMFARAERPGWDAWGDQSTNSIQL